MSASASANPSANRGSILYAEQFDNDILSNERESTWLQPFARTWEDIQEDVTGNVILPSAIQQQLERKARLPSESTPIIAKGIIRYFYLVIDYSSSMSLSDLRPTRRVCTLFCVQEFIREFFDMNPLSQLGIILCHHKIAEKISELSGHPEEQIRCLRQRCEDLTKEEEEKQKRRDPNSNPGDKNVANAGGSGSAIGGEFSLANGLEMAKNSLVNLPPYGSREILVIMSSLASVDAVDIHSTINTIANDKQSHAAASHPTTSSSSLLPITCSVIHLSAELYICTQLVNRTNGLHFVILNKDHLQASLRRFLTPFPHTKEYMAKSSRVWIKMAFPSQCFSLNPFLCQCHTTLQYTGYQCPQCKSIHCEVPTTCGICGLTLINSAQLARSFHHLFPTTPFRMINPSNSVNVNGGNDIQNGNIQRQQSNPMDTTPDTAYTQLCQGCKKLLYSQDDVISQCPKCSSKYCIDCDEFIHLNLHNCPGCLMATS